MASAPDRAATAFVVTDSTAVFVVVSELPAGVEPIRLYENYLTTFAINQFDAAVKFELIDYQRQAAAEVLKRLARGRHDWRGYGARSAFALSAMTGSRQDGHRHGGDRGAAVRFGRPRRRSGPEGAVPVGYRRSGTQPADTQQDARGIGPALAEPAAGPARRLLHEPTLPNSKVYFLNIQQLGRNAAFASKAGDSLRTKTGWEIIGDTITSGTDRLYVVVDEAHRGHESHR